MSNFAMYKSIYTNWARPNISNILKRHTVDRSELKHISENWMTYGTSTYYRPDRPVGPDPTPSVLVEKNRPLGDPRSFACTLSHVELVGPDAVAITSGGKYVLEEVAGSQELLADAFARTIYDKKLPVRTDSGESFNSPVASLAGVWSRGFFHWFADYLPRVRSIEKYAAVSGSYPDIFISPDPPDWIKESLKYIGVPGSKIKEWSGNRVNIDQFIIPSIPREISTDAPPWGYTQSPTALQWVSKRIRSNIELEKKNKKRIVITRREATSRRIHNEQQVINMLSRFGFEPVNLNKISLGEQVSLFAEADVVVAPHGAGLINTIHADNIKILEIFGDYQNACYYSLAGGFNFPYRYMICEQVNNDIYVNVDKLETIVREWVIE